MLGWMAYAMVVSALLGASAWAAERSAYTRRASTRLYWGLAIVASLILPIAMASVSIQAPSLTGAIERAAPSAATPLRQMTSSALAPAQWIGRLPASPNLDRLLIGAWVLASALLILGVAVHALLLHRGARRWATARVAGVEVLVSDRVGPAVVGLLRPRIVLPRWALEAPPEAQALIIAHERTHLDADDARLLAVAILLIVCMPWNLPLWWQLHRLRFAIEVDCDARVLRGGGEMTRYGETLIMVGERHSSGLAVVAAMSEPKSNLEQRLRKMLSKPKKFAWASGTALAALSLVLAASAAEVSPPNRDTGTIHELAVAPAILDNYVGFYSLNDQSVLTVTREGGQLSAKLTGQPAFPVFARTKTEFFYKVVKAEISFVTDAGGKATSLVLHQNGADLPMPRITQEAALKLNGAVQARVTTQTASPGSEAALRRLVAEVMADKVDYSQLEPPLAKAMQAQGSKAKDFMNGLGPVRSIAFSGVGPGGNDVYLVRQERGVSRWVIGLAPNGKISLAAVTPGP
jgi:beta-lactamase regulating signal transducer with metallopeptidase domain